MDFPKKAIVSLWLWCWLWATKKTAKEKARNFHLLAHRKVSHDDAKCHWKSSHRILLTAQLHTFKELLCWVIALLSNLCRHVCELQHPNWNWWFWNYAVFASIHFRACVCVYVSICIFFNLKMSTITMWHVSKAVLINIISILSFTAKQPVKLLYRILFRVYELELWIEVV